MHHPNSDRTRCEPVVRCLGLFVVMNVNVAVLEPVVFVGVGMYLLGSKDLPDRVQAQDHEHYPDDAFKNSFGAF